MLYNEKAIDKGRIKLILTNAVKHFITITKHKWVVFKLCCMAGEPWRGFMHDWSKYSLTEFWESAKYYNGKYSPIHACRRLNGYSKAWLHHKGRNKHHHEYWYDYNTEQKTPIMPYKYAVEMICDNLAAGIVYNGKDWTNSTQIEYWNKVESKKKVNPQINKFAKAVFKQVSKEGINPVIKKKNLKKLYKEIVLEEKEELSKIK